jgi:hypothetical protein
MSQQHAPAIEGNITFLKIAPVERLAAGFET